MILSLRKQTDWIGDHLKSLFIWLKLSSSSKLLSIPGAIDDIVRFNDENIIVLLLHKIYDGAISKELPLVDQIEVTLYLLRHVKIYEEQIAGLSRLNLCDWWWKTNMGFTVFCSFLNFKTIRQNHQIANKRQTSLKQRSICWRLLIKKASNLLPTFLISLKVKD